jgi:hypothetical protein
MFVIVEVQTVFSDISQCVSVFGHVLLPNLTCLASTPQNRKLSKGLYGRHPVVLYSVNTACQKLAKVSRSLLPYSLILLRHCHSHLVSLRACQLVTTGWRTIGICGILLTYSDVMFIRGFVKIKQLFQNLKSLNTHNAQKTTAFIWCRCKIGTETLNAIYTNLLSSDF